MVSTQISEALSTIEISPEAIAHIELAAQVALTNTGLSTDAGITIVLTDDDQLHKLNQEFLGVDAPTDVLSFPAGETDPDSGKKYLGDILISYPRAATQASSGKHAVQDELQLLVVHGVLHLLGYDHVEEDEKIVMWALQSKILADLGCPVIPPN